MPHGHRPIGHRVSLMQRFARTTYMHHLAGCRVTQTFTVFSLGSSKFFTFSTGTCRESNAYSHSYFQPGSTCFTGTHAHIIHSVPHGHFSNRLRSVMAFLEASCLMVRTSARACAVLPLHTGTLTKSHLHTGDRPTGSHSVQPMHDHRNVWAIELVPYI